MKSLRTTLLFLSMFVMSISYAYDFKVDGIYYSITSTDDQTVAITRGYTNYDGDFVIPYSITYADKVYSVTSIDKNAFWCCSNLLSVSIPNSVTNIGEQAFYKCSSLTSIVIPNTVSSIGEGAFSRCSSLTSATLSNSITTIEEELFYFCSNLKSIIIPDGVTCIGEKAFSDCSALVSVSIPNSVTYIGDYAFYFCTGLTSVTIPNSVTCIGREVFRVCSSLTSVTIPKSLTSIGELAFAACDNLASIKVENGNSKYDSRDNCNGVIETETNKLIIGCKNTTIPNSVISIGMKAFYECFFLSSITIPNSVTEIEWYAFYGCRSLSSITIPSSVSYIGVEVFEGCCSLASIKVEQGNNYYDSRDNCNAIVSTRSNRLEYGCQNTIIPNTVTSIESFAFFGQKELTSITIPESVKEIGGAAFQGCSKLNTVYFNAVDANVNIWVPIFANGVKKIVFGENVIKIPEYLMHGCEELENVYIPESVISIGEYAFYDCLALTSISIPSSIMNIGNLAFAKCTGITSVYCKAEGVPATGQNVFYGVNMEQASLFVHKNVIPTYKVTSPWKDFGNILPIEVIDPIISYENGEIVIDCETPDAKIYYTLDGSDPATSSKLYKEPIGAITPCTVRAIAKKAGFDNSDVVSFQLTKVPVPEIRCVNGNVYMSVDSEDVSIYYTLDGSEPTEKSTLYKGKIEVDRNYTIKAIGYQENHINSDVVEYKVTGVKTKQPEIIYTNFQLYLTCQSAGSKIYYTLDGTNPKMDGKIYTTPVPVYTDCIVKAYAKSPDLDDSDISTMDINVTEYTCATPQISRVGNSVKIECLTDDVTIYYTIDGQNPTDHSAKYSSPIVLSHNCTIKAIAMKDGHLPSPVSTFTADWFRAETPTFSFADGLLTISCGTDGSIIYYELGEGTPSRSSNKYVQPIALTDNRIVKAIAVADGFNDSEIATYNPNMFSCETPLFAYDGRAITISTETPGADIYYTMDGTNPTEQSNRYTGTTILNGLCTIRAIAMKENMNNSTVSTLALPAYYNGGNVYVETPGKMSEAFIWCGGMPELKSLTVCGKLNATDIALIKNSQSMKFLDLVDVTIDELQDEALADMNLVSVAFPTARFNVGKRLLVGCNDLAVIDWNSTNKVPDDIVGDAELPNLLLYLKSVNSAGNNVFKNVVVGNTAEAITLQDSEFSNFYCLREFTARKITYTHNYSQKTGSGKCTGWETIALPFTPTAIHHATNGQMAPFAINDAAKKPFWLCELTESGFVNSDAIVANTPYIIAMPNNEHYADEYILSGDVTFEGSNVKVLASSDLNYGNKGNKTFIPNFMVTDKNECMTLNVGETYEGHAMGSMFVQGLRNASPFEAYVTMEGLQAMARQIFCIDGTETGIYNIESENINISIEGRNVLITGITDGDNICIYNVAGSVISSKVATDDSIYVNNLPSGVFVLAVKRNGMMIKSIKLRV